MQSRTSLPWLLLVLYLALLFGTLPIAPDIWMSVNAKSGGVLANLLPILGIIGFGTLYGILLISKGWQARRELLSLTIIALCYGVLFSVVAVVPLEQYHLIEYGFLSILVHRAFRKYGTFKNVAGWGILTVVIVGIADEVYQWYLPERFFDTRDIVLNAVSGLLAFALIGLFIVKKPEKAGCSSKNGRETT